MSNRRKTNNVFLLMAITIAVCTIIISVVLRSSVEVNSRQQAVYNLEQIKYCYENTSRVLSSDKAQKVCTAKVKVGFTGDVYVLDADNLNFLVENSLDVPSDISFTKEAVGGYFYDWDSAENALRTIKLGKNSSPEVRVQYSFNKAPEWLEWKYLPDDVNDGGAKVIAVHGVQSSEAYRNFSTVEYLIFGLNGLVVFILLILHKLQDKAYICSRSNYDKQQHVGAD